MYEFVDHIKDCELYPRSMGSHNLSTRSDVNRFTLSRRRLLQQLRDDGSRNGEKDDFGNI